MGRDRIAGQLVMGVEFEPHTIQFFEYSAKLEK